jgi:hypothetical protein
VAIAQRDKIFSQQRIDLVAIDPSSSYSFLRRSNKRSQRGKTLVVNQNRHN